VRAILTALTAIRFQDGERLWLKVPKPWPLGPEIPTHLGYKPSQDPRELIEAET